MQLERSTVKKYLYIARRRWLTPIILATQEAEIWRIVVRSQPRQIVRETLFQKTLHKNRAGGVQAPVPQKKIK
jgi:hypothetical protein